jgi:hypothetical protein
MYQDKGVAQKNATHTRERWQTLYIIRKEYKHEKREI